jgi:hypothetical protein
VSTIQVQTPPAAEPVTLATLKNALRVSISDDDALLGIYLQSGREIVEAESGRSLVNKVYRQSHDRFPHLHNWTDYGTGYYYGAPRYSRGHDRRDFGHAIKLLRSPLIVGSSWIQYVGTDGNLYTMLPGPSSAGNPYQTPDRWAPDEDYELGSICVDSNENLEKVIAVTEAETGGQSETSAVEPTWNAINVTTTDRDLTWLNIGPPPTANGGNYIEDADSEPSRLLPQYAEFWPETLKVPNAVQVFFTAGYGADAATAPATLKVALMMTAGVSYRNREKVTPEQLRELDFYQNLIYPAMVRDYDPTP